jgi:PEGA domain
MFRKLGFAVLLAFSIVGMATTGRALVQYFQAWKARQAARALKGVDIITAPAGAEVAVNGKKIGASPSHTQLASGAYTVTVSLAGYESQNVPLTIEAEPTTVSVTLKPTPMDLRVVTDQATGSVWLDEEAKGDLDAGGIVIAGVQPGVHQLKVRTRSGEAMAAFDFQPGQLPAPTSLPTDRSLAVFFVGRSLGKSRMECSCAPIALKIDNADQSLGNSGLEMNLAEGEHVADLPIMGGKKLVINESRLPAATVALYWGARTPAPAAKSIDDLLEEANTFITNHQYQDASARLNEVLSRNPGDDRVPILQRRLDRLKALGQ